MSQPLYYQRLSKTSRWRALSTPDLLMAITFMGIFTMAVRVAIDPDTWWHLRTGQYIVEHQTIPTTDPFSHTKLGEIWINHSWLAQVILYGIFAAGGWPALALTVAGLASLAFWFVRRQIEANVFVTAFVMILGAVVSSVVWAARPQMISFTLTASVAYLLHRFKRQNGRLWPWLPLIMLVWANIHGGFAIGFMLMLAYLAGEVMNRLTGHRDDPVVAWSGLKQLMLAGLVSLGVVAINPHTWRMWFYPFQTVGIGALRDFIQEWQSPDFHAPEVQPFLLMLLLVVVVLGQVRRPADWTDLILVALWTGWSLFAGRNIALFGLIVTPILARYADFVWTQQWQTWGYTTPPLAGYARGTPVKSILNWLLLGLVSLAALIKIALPLDSQLTRQVEQARFPAQAVTFIQNERPDGPMFNSYNWGGYLIFKLWPAYPVYIDGRTDLYDDVFIRRYLSVVVAEEEWAEILAEDGINLVFIERNSTLAQFLGREPGWREIYRDKMAVVFERERLISP